MQRLFTLLALVPLAACASAGEASTPPPLALDQRQPELALFEHVLSGYFAGAGLNTGRTCASLLPAPLTARQERALMERFVRLSPAAQCAEGDSVVQIYEFACRTDALCNGWVTRPGAPATRYAMRFDGKAWRFDRDRGIVGE